MAANDSSVVAEGRSIVTTRIYDAPPVLVWKMWSDPQHLDRWWGPNGFATATSAFDMRPGGVWRFVMHGPDGRDYQNRIVYEIVEPPVRIVYRHSDPEGADPVSFHTTVTFEDLGGRTRLTMRAVFPTVEERERVEKEYGAVEGAKQTLGRLADYLAARP